MPPAHCLFNAAAFLPRSKAPRHIKLPSTSVVQALMLSVCRGPYPRCAKRPSTSVAQVLFLSFFRRPYPRRTKLQSISGVQALILFLLYVVCNGAGLAQIANHNISTTKKQNLAERRPNRPNNDEEINLAMYPQRKRTNQR